ncbi:nucleolar protein dao-5-like isoform X6 [Daphnia pulex]|uniref:nucleolar protein dao-5-like isoform X6 n=1 Tax=Daphnia pulex TaxID=6669 RepID=UPI001EDDEC95|nr:nucleolar protein dao-5-like isoform X6 [Daphnia pulex]
MSNTRLSTASSYSKNKAKKDLHPFYDSSASDQERSDASGDDEVEDDFIGFSPQVSHTNCYNENYFLDTTQSQKQRMSISGQENAAKLNKTGDREHQLKGSFSRKPATTTRQTPIEKKKKLRTNSDSDDFFQEPESLSGKIDKKTKPGPSARNKVKATTKNPPSAKKRGKTNAESRSTETGDSPEPAAKRPMVASERKTISAEEPATSSTEHLDKDNITKKNPRGNKVSTIVDEVVETDLSAGGSKSKPTKSTDPTLRENKGRSRGIGRPKRQSSSSPTKSLDNHSRVETKKSEAKNDEAHRMTLKTADKSKERKYRFLSSSESEVEDEVEDEEDDKVEDEEDDKVEDEEDDKVEDEEHDEDDGEDDNIFLSPQKTKSHKISVPSATLKTPASVANKVSELGTPKTSKFRFLPEPVPPPRTPRRTLTLVKESSPNRVEQSISIPEDVANAELHKRSQKETPLIRPSTSRANEESSEETPLSKRRRFPDSSKKQSSTKRLQSPVKSSQQLNDLENDIYAHGDDSGLIEEVLKRTMLRSANSTNQAPLSSAIDPSTLPVPNRSHLRTQFNLYLASPGDPVRVQQLSNAEHSMSLVHLLPKIVFALKINNPIMVVRLKGSVEFRSNPHVPSRILLNSSTRLVDLKAGILHVVNTGEQVASFVLFETF